MEGRNVPTIGVTCNAWGNYTQQGQTVQAVQLGTYSAIVDTFNAPFVSVFGNLTEASSTTINVQYSADGINFNTVHSVTVASSADFGIDCMCAARYVRLNSSNPNAVGYATVSAKG